MLRWMVAVTTPQTKQLAAGVGDIHEELEGVLARRITDPLHQTEVSHRAPGLRLLDPRQDRVNLFLRLRIHLRLP